MPPTPPPPPKRCYVNPCRWYCIFKQVRCPVLGIDLPCCDTNAWRVATTTGLPVCSNICFGRLQEPEHGSGLHNSNWQLRIHLTGVCCWSASGKSAGASHLCVVLTASLNHFLYFLRAIFSFTPTVSSCWGCRPIRASISSHIFLFWILNPSGRTSRMDG